jgi:hypothetical protein
MEAQAVIFEPGLTDQEISKTEEHFRFVFPPDLRAFLRYALPVGFEGRTSTAFPNWRSGEYSDLEEKMGLPFDGLAFDIENNVFWMDSWGPKPHRLSDAIDLARNHVAAAPTLIPVFSHRYIPDDPHDDGNPVFSVSQADVVYFGQNLWDYLQQTFEVHEDEWWYNGQRYAEWTDEQYLGVHRHIPFWSDLVSGEGRTNRST